MFLFLGFIYLQEYVHGAKHHNHNNKFNGYIKQSSSNYKDCLLLGVVLDTSHIQLYHCVLIQSIRWRLYNQGEVIKLNKCDISILFFLINGLCSISSLSMPQFQLPIRRSLPDPRWLRSYLRTALHLSQNSFLFFLPNSLQNVSSCSYLIQ